MIDQPLSQHRKNRVNLKDYDYEKDIQNRLVINHLNVQDLSVLEEILYNSIQFLIEDLEESLELNSQNVMESIQKLLPTELFTINGDEITVNKEVRKYFESQLVRFEDDFTPGLDFVQSLLKSIPIHILPNWYQVPKTSNNIFHSLVERYFLTPQLFERYLLDLEIDDHILRSMIDTVFSSPQLQLPAHELIARLNLTEQQFQEYMLVLEFSFVLFTKFEKVGSEYVQIVLPFHEWREYALFVRSTTPCPIKNNEEVQPYRMGEYAFSDDMAYVLELSRQSPLPLVYDHNDSRWNINPQQRELLAEKLGEFGLKTREELEVFDSYTCNLIQKLLTLQLAEVDNFHLKPTKAAGEWIRLNPEKRAFFTYKHPMNRIDNDRFSSHLNTERNIREIEKSISRIVDSGWIYFNDFMKGLVIPLSEESRIELRKTGKAWKYNTPDYTEEERSFISMTILEWLFESGIICTGMHNDQICFCTTQLGKSLFGA
ncbi:MAG: hypothetical protein K9M07_06665 [Simkaniaceae bacterium]|nr:hypothetical protein [Simkaniaceae bacterium]MCF7852904.1 hypothetical protein [Simkaniaceae bacterium]